MDNVGKPLIGVLVATVLVFALYMVELRPKSNGGSSGGVGSGQSLGAYSGDIAKAQGAVAISNASNARSGQLSPTPPGSSATTSTPSSSTSSSGTSAATTAGHPATGTGAKKASSSSKANASASANSATHKTSKTSSKAPSTPAGRASAVAAALSAHKVLALLFYNPSGSDDQAVAQELKTVSTHHGAVFKLAIPVAELANYVSLTEQVPINMTPTLVVIGRNGQAGEIAGFTDTFEINQRIADALRTKPLATK